MESGKLTKDRLINIKKFERLKIQAGDVTETTTGYIAKQLERLGVNDDRLNVITGEGLKGEIGQEIGSNIDNLKDKFKGLAENIHKAESESKNFFDELRKGGAFALAAEGVNSMLGYIRMTKELEARGLTSFDFNSPIGMYSERARFQTYSDVRTRDQIYSMVGEVIAGGLGLTFGGPMAGLALSYIGKGLGSQVASWQNIPEQAETEEKLKYLNQSINAASNMVVVQEIILYRNYNQAPGLELIWAV